MAIGKAGWISIIVMIVAYLLSKSNGQSTKKSMLIGAASGAASYALTENSTTGQEINSKLSSTADNMLPDQQGENMKVENGIMYIKQSDGTWKPYSTNGSNSASDGSSAAAALAAVGTAALNQAPAIMTSGADAYVKTASTKTGLELVKKATNDLPTWLWVAGGGLLIYLILK